MGIVKEIYNNALDTFDSHHIKLGAGIFIWCKLGGGITDGFTVLLRKELMFGRSDMAILSKDILDVTVNCEAARHFCEL